MTDRVQAPFGRRAAVIAGVEHHGAYTVLICLDAGGPLPDPGQFYMLSTERRWGGGADERPFLPRAFSVMRARAAETVELHFLLEDVGPGTARLAEAEPGEALGLVGPLGNGFAAPPPGAKPLLVGGGVGIAPLAILQDRLEAPTRPLLGFRDAAHAEGAALLGDPLIATDDGSAGHHGLVTDLLIAELERAPEVVVYACGPPPMLEAVRGLCAERGVAAQLALESGMACGFGACFGCVIPTRTGLVRLCIDGPVLAASQLERVH
ncbi:MAG TPA: dihydroorotate dehydrogenase electron transfer subunit [Solirubrobacteraceae bacterium]|nr:dihydroorotate dehydrogenase electron transfer subunit [Solirubrobacteraceae bacterium]